MSPKQQRCLNVIARRGDEYGLYLDTIAEQAGMTRREARVAVRALARRGYARLSQVFDEGTGLTAGSAYFVTHDGLVLATPDPV